MSYVSHERTRPRSCPQVRPYQVWSQSEKNCSRESVNGVVSTDGQTDSLIPVYSPFNFVERGIIKHKNTDLKEPHLSFEHTGNSGNTTVSHSFLKHTRMVDLVCYVYNYLSSFLIVQQVQKIYYNIVKLTDLESRVGGTDNNHICMHVNWNVWISMKMTFLPLSPNWIEGYCRRRACGHYHAVYALQVTISLGFLSNLEHGFLWVVSQTRLTDIVDFLKN